MGRISGIHRYQALVRAQLVGLDFVGGYGLDFHIEDRVDVIGIGDRKGLVVNIARHRQLNRAQEEIILGIHGFPLVDLEANGWLILTDRRINLGLATWQNGVTRNQDVRQILVLIHIVVNRSRQGERTNVGHHQVLDLLGPGLDTDILT